MTTIGEREQRALIATSTFLTGELRANGHATLRGRGIDGGSFAGLTEQLSDRFAHNPQGVRTSHVRRFRSLGKRFSLHSWRHAWHEGIDLHNENWAIPGASPDVVWIRCEQPALVGGELLLCDGVELLRQLSERARQFAKQATVRRSTTLTVAQWRQLFGVDELQGVKAMLDAASGLRWSRDVRGRLTCSFDAPLVRATLFGGQPTLQSDGLSSWLAASVAEELTQQSDPRAVPDWFASEVLDVVEAIGFSVELGAGDAIVIDNSRMLHGVAGYEGGERTVFTRCGFLRTELLSRMSRQPSRMGCGLDSR